MSNNAKNLRMCVACREHSDKSELLRFVKTKDGKIQIDETKTADGRGVWVHNSAECIQKLTKKRLLNAAFKCAVDESILEGLNDRQGI